MKDNNKSEIEELTALLIQFRDARRRLGKSKNRYGFKMHALKFLFTILFIAVTCLACARLEKHDVDAGLISEMEKNCKKVEIKKDYDQSLFVIAYTGKVSKAGCPLALIRGWKDGKIIEERQVEICGCKDK